MKFLHFILIFILAALFQYFINIWWIFVLPCMMVSFFNHNKKWQNSFYNGFVAIGLLWFSYLVFINYSNHNILSNRISLLILKIQSPILLILLTSLIGAIIGGLASLIGWRIRKES